MNPRKTVLLLSLAAFALGCQEPPSEVDTAEPESTPSVTGVWLGMTPTDEPKLLAPTMIASSLDEYNSTFSPDGKTFFFTTNTPSQGIICYTEMQDDSSWSPVRVAPFSGTYSEYDPLFSPDGKRLYYSSERPISDTSEGGNSNIWFFDLAAPDWDAPEYVPLTDDPDYHSSIANDGSIWFNVWNNGDLWRAIPSDTGYTIERLPEIINSKSGEGDPFIAPDQSYLIFRGYQESLGAGDMYISYQTDTGWSEPQNLGEPINSQWHEMCPFVTADGKYFLWASSRNEEGYQPQADQEISNVREQHQSAINGQLNVYYINASFIEEMRPK